MQMAQKVRFSPHLFNAAKLDHPHLSPTRSVNETSEEAARKLCVCWCVSDPYVKTIILPRQARDKHRKIKKGPFMHNM
jgi:hypothetical protein